MLIGASGSPLCEITQAEAERFPWSAVARSSCCGITRKTRSTAAETKLSHSSFLCGTRVTHDRRCELAAGRSGACGGWGATGRAPGTTGEEQKQPAILPAHTATRAQHSPPLYVLQQQSTSCATFDLLSIADTSAAAGGTRQRAIVSARWPQRGSAFADTARINAMAITMILVMGSSRGGSSSSRCPNYSGLLWRTGTPVPGTASGPSSITVNGDHPATESASTAPTTPLSAARNDLAVLRSPTCYRGVLWRSVMVKKIKKASQTTITSHEPNPFAAAYATRLARQVSQELGTPRQRSDRRKTKSRSRDK